MLSGERLHLQICLFCLIDTPGKKPWAKQLSPIIFERQDAPLSTSKMAFSSVADIPVSSTPAWR